MLQYSRTTRLALGRGSARAAVRGRAWTRLFQSAPGRLQQQQQDRRRPEGGPVSPLRVFVDTFKAELSKSQELQDNIKLLADESERLSESAQLKSARSAYQKAKERADAASTSSSKAIKAATAKVSEAAQGAWESEVSKVGRKVVGHAARGVGRAVDEGTRPVRQSEVYKSVKKNVGEVIDDGGSSRYGGYLMREERRKARERREREDTARGKRRIAADEHAGQAVILHRDSKWTESWNKFKESSQVLNRFADISRSFNESENPLITSVRSVTERISDFFTQENETATAVRLVRMMDPSFNTESFLRDLREYIIPEILDAYVQSDEETLKIWLGDAPFAVWSQVNSQYLMQGLRSAGSILDIRGVDIASCKVLENDIPVFIVSFRSQETHVYRNLDNGEIMAGVEDSINLVQNVAVFTRIEDELSNSETSGWRIMDFQRGHSRNYY